MFILKYSFKSLALYLLLSTVVCEEVYGHGLVTRHMQSKSSSNVLMKSRNLFSLNELYDGNIVPIYFGNTFTSKFPKFLSKQQADLIPFSSHELPLILKFFGLSEGSLQAKAIEFSLKSCEEKAMKGDNKSCVTSLESMVQFMRKAFKSIEKPFKVISTSPLQPSTKFWQNYTIVGEATNLPNERVVICHKVAYPYAVFYCHYQVTEHKVFEVSLKGEDGTLLNSVVICHMDSTTMNPKDIAFSYLGFKWGPPICHFVPPGDLVWVPAFDRDQKDEKMTVS